MSYKNLSPLSTANFWMQMKQIAGALFFLLSCVLWSSETKPIQVDCPEDYAILDQFFKMAMSFEEYGYVLEGSKPISIRNFRSPDHFPVTKDFEYESKEFTHTFLVREALNIWNRLCSHQKNFALKAVALKEDSKSIFPMLEVQFVNISKLREVIDKNIDLFRYILGPTVTIEQLIDKIARSDEPLMDCLQHNLTLVGIVLGFGSHNSVVGGRIETISALSISRDIAPFTPQSNLMDGNKEHSLDFLIGGGYGCYYLEYAGGDDINFRDDHPLLRPSPCFTTLEEEVLAIDGMFEPIPPYLWEEPKFVFGGFTGGPPNQPFFEHLQQTQRKIRDLLESPDFLELVLEKIGEKKPIITCDRLTFANALPILFRRKAEEWSQILWSALHRLESKTERSVFMDAFRHQTSASREVPAGLGLSTAMLKGLNKALSNLQKANTQFKLLSKKASKDKSLNVIVPEQLYFKTTLSGSGKELLRQDHVRVGYVIEDREENVLFANFDTWLRLSQTIPGFAHGMQGMRVGEKRTIFVHPVFGYGAKTTLPPCIGLTLKVHLLDVKEGAAKPLPALTPLSLDWIEDKEYCCNMKKSIQQRPYFVGSFYRDLVDKIEKVDKTALIAQLEQQVAEDATLYRK